VGEVREKDLVKQIVKLFWMARTFKREIYFAWGKRFIFDFSSLRWAGGTSVMRCVSGFVLALSVVWRAALGAGEFPGAFYVKATLCAG